MSTIPNFVVLPANMAFATRSRVVLKPVDRILTGATAAITGVITKAGHGFANGDRVQYVTGTGFTGLISGTVYYVRDADTDTFKVALTATGSAVEISVVGSAGTFAEVAGFETHKFDDNSQAPQSEKVEMPDNQGRYHPVRIDYSSGAEAHSFVNYEVKRLLKIFGGALQGVRDCEVELWIPDSKDAAGKCFLKSETFPASVTRGSDVSFGDKKHSFTSIKIESTLGRAIQWTPDADTV